MTIDIKAPTFPESVQEGTLISWRKQPGEPVARDELLVDIETDKVVLEVVAPADGVLKKLLKIDGEIIASGEVLALFDPGSAVASPAPHQFEQPAPAKPAVTKVIASPAARKIAEERGIDLAQMAGTGRDGRITKEDALVYQPPKPTPTMPPPRPPPGAGPSLPASATLAAAGERVEKRVPMTRMRARIAERLLQVTHTTAMLTTFNEADLHRIMDLRAQFKDQFSQRHNGTRLGFMGFFVRAAVEALKRYPVVNAALDGTDVIYHGYQDIGVAVSTDRGLVVPVLRNADQMSIAEIESQVAEFGARAREGKLTIEEMNGGTFTITNGGVFGSMMSTPILNPPQSAILGMHAIKDRPVVENGQIVIRPMMYLALSYDHRLIDGRDAVLFLVAIKEMIEYPAKILLEI